jgi:hypothetical protein
MRGDPDSLTIRRNNRPSSNSSTRGRPRRLPNTFAIIPMSPVPITAPELVELLVSNGKASILGPQGSGEEPPTPSPGLEVDLAFELVPLHRSASTDLGRYLPGLPSVGSSFRGLDCNPYSGDSCDRGIDRIVSSLDTQDTKSFNRHSGPIVVYSPCILPWWFRQLRPSET